MQLPEEAKKFDTIDKTFKSIMTATSKNPNVVDACTADSRLLVLVTLSDRLDTCQKSLSDYLDTKRCAFPRFFFISDDELLSVLGNNDPASIQVALIPDTHLSFFGVCCTCKYIGRNRLWLNTVKQEV